MTSLPSNLTAKISMKMPFSSDKIHYNFSLERLQIFKILIDVIRTLTVLSCMFCCHMIDLFAIYKSYNISLNAWHARQYNRIQLKNSSYMDLPYYYF